MPLFSIFKQKKAPQHESERHLAKRLALTRISKMKGKNAFNKYTEFMHKFFAYWFHMHYAFTWEELAKEATRHKLTPEAEAHLLEYIYKLIEAEYSEKKPENSELKSLINEGKQLIREM